MSEAKMFIWFYKIFSKFRKWSVKERFFENKIHRNINTGWSLKNIIFCELIYVPCNCIKIWNKNTPKSNYSNCKSNSENSSDTWSWTCDFMQCNLFKPSSFLKQLIIYKMCFVKRMKLHDLLGNPSFPKNLL